ININTIKKIRKSMLFQHPSILNTLPLNFLYSCINHVYKGANYNQKVTLHPKYELFESQDWGLYL
ncbi:hypothetical protein C2303_26730, partial [Salmonella enterica subsp. enterica serovar Heidelberg]|nr:hypothetical protein [Salmonella enterica subsp. enterica serovar Heidelberg]